MLASSACFYGLIQQFCFFFLVFLAASSPVFSGTEDEAINLLLSPPEELIMKRTLLAETTEGNCYSQCKMIKRTVSTTRRLQYVISHKFSKVVE